MNKKKKPAMQPDVIKMARIALSEMLPKHEEPDQRSKQLQNLIKRIPLITFKKVEAWKDQVFELGRKEGFDDMIIGKWVRKAMADAEYSERTIRRMLPDTAKQEYERYPKQESDKTSNYQAPVTDNTDTQKQELEDEAPTGYYQMPVEDFNINDVEQYDRLFLIKVVQYLYQQMKELKEVKKKK